MREIDGWSLIEVDMDESKRTFTVKRRLSKSDLGTPGLQPTFIFYTEGAQILLNDKGTFLVKWVSKTLGGRERDIPFLPSGMTPKLKRLYSKNPLARRAKKAMKQLFFPGKSKVE